MATPRYFDEDGNEVSPRRPNGLINGIIWIVLIATLVLVWALAGPAMYARYIGSSPLPTEMAGNVGGQAPPSVRGTNPDPIAPAAVATPIPGIAQSEADGLRIYQTTIAAQQQVAPVAPTPATAPLPLNSAGAPIIDETQQQQLDMSGQMAADEQQAAQRAQQLADARSRAPDVSKVDAEAELHRDLCHVPHANPATCDKGLYKPTPIGAP